MSQIFVPMVSSTPSIPTSFVTDSGTVIPSTNTVNINGGQTTTNNDFGIRVIANPTLSNNQVIQNTNRATATVTTNNAVATTILTFPMGIIPSTFYVYGNIQAFNSSTPAFAAYSFSGGYRTDGVTSVELGTEFHDTFQDAALTTSDIFLSASGAGNNIIVQVQGVGVLSINWNILFEYRQVS